MPTGKSLSGEQIGFPGGSKPSGYGSALFGIEQYRGAANPDLLVVDDQASITGRGIEGAPLLVVEILSKATADRDRGVKARRYAELGIRHYWLVDPDAQRVECHRLAGRAYEQTVVADGNTTLEAPAFAELTLPLSSLWADSDAPA